MSDDKRKIGTAATLSMDTAPLSAETAPTLVPQPPLPRPDSASDSGVLSSTDNSTSVDGTVPIHEGRITEAQARDVLERKFTEFGLTIEADHALYLDQIACTLDGFDPRRLIGYAYISHADEDVVTDIDSDTEFALTQLGIDDKAWVLILHDTHVQSMDHLLMLVDQFLSSIPLRP